MVRQYFNRYEDYTRNGEVKTLPGIILEPLSSDKVEVYKKGVTRLDKLSQLYYNNPYHGFLILARNPQWGGLEFYIPDGEILYIPFTFSNALSRYKAKITKHIELYGE